MTNQSTITLNLAPEQAKAISTFFELGSPKKQLKRLRYWRDLIISNQSCKKVDFGNDMWLSFERLLNATSEIVSTDFFNSLDDMDEEEIRNFLKKEKNLLLYSPKHLSFREKANPYQAILKIFKQDTPTGYIDYLNNAIEIDSVERTIYTRTRQLINTYENLQKLIEACWLIHEREISRNSRQELPEPFSDSDPNALTEEELENPFLAVQAFYSCYGPDGWRDYLKDWFRVATSEKSQWRGDHSDLFFLYEKINNLLNAGYLISSQRLTYVPKRGYCEGCETFGHWLKRVEEREMREENTRPENYLSKQLSASEIENPNEFLCQTLGFENICHLREGLHRWLHAGLSNRTSILEAGDEYVWPLYEMIEKIIEAFYLIMISTVSETENNN